ncbi:hypothetical protein [Rheinheimera sp.]|uniref:hypothetical protein n=1 Tax=Rheinheimera sp. TaxID=1869214 RepID=UPI0040480559
MSRARAYVFTLNNWTPQELDLILELNSKYIIIGDEKGECGTPHLQGYVYFANATSFGTIKHHIPRGHIEKAKGSPRQNFEYCSKENILFEAGTRPEQGKRTDIQTIKEYIEETDNPNMRDIILHHATSYQSIKTAEVMLKYLEKGRDPNNPPKILWYCGPTGTGKTRSAWEQYPEAYIKDNSHKWWDGYDQHEVVIIDDMRWDTFPWAKLLTITDRYPNQVECKNGNRQLTAHTIIITSPYTPEEMFDGRVHEDLGQFKRRITEIKIFT